tara:strand:- start:74035 stop:74916 length:882 start_codon:yes stop_codon:yes gene_type:complete
MTIAFCEHGLNRDDHARANPARLAELRLSPLARLLAMEGLNPVLGSDNALTWGDASGLTEVSEVVFLGLDGEAPLFAPIPAAGDTRPAYEQRPAWDALSLLPPRDLAIYGGARSLVDWHARHRFCANCGGPTQIAKGGWQRNCDACGAQHFPRTDPVAIMLVEHEGDLLLGRGTRFPERRYSALAGFIEPGESVEQGVAREVLEEVGVVVSDVGYIASQPWPFPSQLMLGCHGTAQGRELTIDETEIADARWFTRAEVATAMDAQVPGEDKSFLPPPPTAIAWHLLNWWLERG